MYFLEQTIEKYIGNSSYKRNIIIMVVGRIVSQTIPIILTPLLTRIYSPEDFGIFAVYSTIVSLLSMISNGRYCLSIILPKEREKAQSLVLLSSLITLITSIVFFLILLILGKDLFSILNIESISKYLVLLILNIVFIGFYEAMFYYELREKRYRVLATNVIIQSLILISVRVGTGYLGYTDLGLILSYLIGYIIGYFLLLLRSDIKFNITFFRDNVRKLISKYSNFPKYSLFSDGLAVLSDMSPSVLLNKAFGSTEAGYYSISDKILGSPTWFITSSVGDVFKQEASEQYRLKGTCIEIFTKTSKALFYIGVIPFTLTFILAPYVVPFLLGENWSPAVDYIRILVIMYFSSFVVRPTAYVIYIVNKQSYAILFQGIRLICIILAFVVAKYLNSLIVGLLLWSGLVTLTNIFIFLISYKLSRDSLYDESSNTETIK